MWYKKLKTHVNVFTTSLSSNPQSKTSQDFLHTCQHLEIRNQDTFIITLSSPPPPPAWPKLPIKPHPADSLDAGEEEDQSKSIVHCSTHQNPQAIQIRTRSDQ